MDQELISRFRSGDPSARTAMRNHLRAVAARVLASPQWRLNAETRTELEKAAAAVALGCPAPDPIGFAVAAMDAAALQGLERRRKEEGLVGRHPTAQLIVSVALETASANQAATLQEHVGDCSPCRNHLEVVRMALRAAASANAAADVPSPSPQQIAPAPKRERAQPARSPRRRRAPPRKEAFQVPWTAVVLVGIGVAGMTWWTGRLSPEEETWKAAAMLPNELPPTAMAAEYTGSTQAAIERLGTEDCPAAASKLGMAFNREQDYNLRYLEGLSHICGHRGPEAFEALQDVNDSVHYDDLPWGFSWWYAHALVLDLRIGEALRELDQIADSKHPRNKDAKALAARLREAY